MQGEDDSVMSEVFSSDEVELVVEDRQFDVVASVSSVVDGSESSSVVFSVTELRSRLKEVFARLANPLHSLPDEVRISEKLLSLCSSHIITEFLEY